MNDKEQRLNTYARRFNTDKLDHGYMKHYANELPDACRSMLEIGVAKGASAAVWNLYYGSSQLDLHLLDLYMNPDLMSAREVRNNGWIPIIGDQSDMNVLSGIDRQFEVIVDDGSHNAHHQLISFKHLFLNNLLPGGLYVMEDLHCNKDPFYYGGAVTNYSDTPLSMFNHFCNSGGEIKNPYFNEGEVEVFRSLIEGVRVYDEKIAFITRKS